MSLQDKVLTQIVRMRSGDVLWVQLSSGVGIDDVESIRNAVVEVMPRECSVILTEHDLIDSLGVASLDDLIRMREAIDQAIAGYASRATMEA